MAVGIRIIHELIVSACAVEAAQTGFEGVHFTTTNNDDRPHSKLPKRFKRFAYNMFYIMTCTHPEKKMTPVWRKSIKRFQSYRIYYVLASYNFMDGNMRNVKNHIPALKTLEQNIAGLESITSRFKSYSIFLCWPTKIQDGGRRPRWRDISTSFDKSISIVKRHVCTKGGVCCICNFVTIHFVTYLHTYRQTSDCSISQIHE
jgi:hypothetical protein